MIFGDFDNTALFLTVLFDFVFKTFNIILFSPPKEYIVFRLFLSSNIILRVLYFSCFITICLTPLIASFVGYASLKRPLIS